MSSVAFTALDHQQRSRLDALANLQAFPQALARWFGVERSTQIHKQIGLKHRPFGQAQRPAYLYRLISRDDKLVKFVVDGSVA